MPTPRRRLNTTDYLLRNIPNEVWHPFAELCAKKRTDKRAALIRLMERATANKKTAQNDPQQS